VLSWYAKGMTTGDIANHLADIHGTDVFPQTLGAHIDEHGTELPMIAIDLDATT
jgi:hypothetical protein